MYSSLPANVSYGNHSMDYYWAPDQFYQNKSTGFLGAYNISDYRESPKITNFTIRSILGLDTQQCHDTTRNSQSTDFGNSRVGTTIPEQSSFPSWDDRLNEESYHQSCPRSPSKNKRIRTIFTQEQLNRLEYEFQRQQYIVGPERAILADSLNLTENQVKIWYQNRRIKMRKQQFDTQESRLLHATNSLRTGG